MPGGPGQNQLKKEKIYGLEKMNAPLILKLNSKTLIAIQNFCRFSLIKMLFFVRFVSCDEI
jgi:hypothetical protein